MENASKALIMVVSILIGVMIIAFMTYMFSDASNLSRSQEAKENEKRISTFNADFYGYETLNDGLVDPNTGNLYKTTTEQTQYARFHASKELNKISDVITAVNEAYDINYKNSNEYRAGYIEYTNGMVIVIDLRENGIIDDIAGSGKDSKSKYVIFPHKDIKSGYLYGMTDTEYDSLMTKIKNRDKNIDISSYQKVECSKFLEFFRESRTATSADNPPDNSTYILYKYYFSGELNINSTTGKIDRVTFTLVTDKKYDS